MTLPQPPPAPFRSTSPLPPAQSARHTHLHPAPQLQPLHQAQMSQTSTPSYSYYSPSPSSLEAHRNWGNRMHTWQTQNAYPPQPRQLGSHPSALGSAGSYSRLMGLGSASWSDTGTGLSEDTGTTPTEVRVGRELDEGRSEKERAVMRARNVNGEWGKNGTNGSPHDSHAVHANGSHGGAISPHNDLSKKHDGLPILTNRKTAPAAIGQAPHARDQHIPPEPPNKVHRFTSHTAHAPLLSSPLASPRPALAPSVKPGPNLTAYEAREAYLASALSLPLDMLSERDRSEASTGGGKDSKARQSSSTEKEKEMAMKSRSNMSKRSAQKPAISTSPPDQTKLGVNQLQAKSGSVGSSVPSLRRLASLLSLDSRENAAYQQDAKERPSAKVTDMGTTANVRRSQTAGAILNERQNKGKGKQRDEVQVGLVEHRDTSDLGRPAEFKVALNPNQEVLPLATSKTRSDGSEQPRGSGMIPTVHQINPASNSNGSKIDPLSRSTEGAANRHLNIPGGTRHLGSAGSDGSKSSRSRTALEQTTLEAPGPIQQELRSNGSAGSQRRATGQAPRSSHPNGDVDAQRSLGSHASRKSSSKLVERLTPSDNDQGGHLGPGTSGGNGSMSLPHRRPGPLRRPALTPNTSTDNLGLFPSATLNPNAPAQTQTQSQTQYQTQSLGRRFRDPSPSNLHLQTRFEPAMYPLPSSIDTPTTATGTTSGLSGMTPRAKVMIPVAARSPGLVTTNKALQDTMETGLASRRGSPFRASRGEALDHMDGDQVETLLPYLLESAPPGHEERQAGDQAQDLSRVRADLAPPLPLSATSLIAPAHAPISSIIGVSPRSPDGASGQPATPPTLRSQSSPPPRASSPAQVNDFHLSPHQQSVHDYRQDDDRVSFEVPSGRHGRLRVSLAWFRDKDRDGVKRNKRSRWSNSNASEAPPPVPSKSPIKQPARPVLPDLARDEKQTAPLPDHERLLQRSVASHEHEQDDRRYLPPTSQGPRARFAPLPPSRLFPGNHQAFAYPQPQPQAYPSQLHPWQHAHSQTQLNPGYQPFATSALHPGSAHIGQGINRVPSRAHSPGMDSIDPPSAPPSPTRGPVGLPMATGSMGYAHPMMGVSPHGMNGVGDLHHHPPATIPATNIAIRRHDMSQARTGPYPFWRRFASPRRTDMRNGLGVDLAQRPDGSPADGVGIGESHGGGQMQQGGNDKVWNWINGINNDTDTTKKKPGFTFGFGFGFGFGDRNRNRTRDTAPPPPPTTVGPSISVAPPNFGERRPIWPSTDIGYSGRPFATAQADTPFLDGRQQREELRQCSRQRGDMGGRRRWQWQWGGGDGGGGVPHGDARQRPYGNEGVGMKAQSGLFGRLTGRVGQRADQPRRNGYEPYSNPNTIPSTGMDRYRSLNRNGIARGADLPSAERQKREMEKEQRRRDRATRRDARLEMSAERGRVRRPDTKMPGLAGQDSSRRLRPQVPAGWKPSRDRGGIRPSGVDGGGSGAGGGNGAEVNRGREQVMVRDWVKNLGAKKTEWRNKEEQGGRFQAAVSGHGLVMGGVRPGSRQVPKRTGLKPTKWSDRRNPRREGVETVQRGNQGGKTKAVPRGVSKGDKDKSQKGFWGVFLS